MKIISSAALLILLMSLFDVNAQTQDTTKTDSIRKDAINLFIDCNYCDISYIKKRKI